MPDPALQPITPALKFNVAFDPAATTDATALDAWRLSIPAKPACYVLCDADDRPILLATTGNLRNALLHRLALPVSSRATADEMEQDTATELPGAPKTDYRAITRLIRYRPCCSAFEAEWTFLENAPLLFPRNFKPMIRHLRTHWITIDPRDTHPQFQSTTQPDFSASANHFRGCIGPIATFAATKQTIDALEDLCDLCRYHDILVQAPHGAPCAYKEMGKCPAPCDGSISLDAYHQMIELAIDLLIGQRDDWTAHVHQQMKQAAAELKFELAARWKLKLQRLSALDSPVLRFARPLNQWHGTYLQPGSRKNAIRPFLITPGQIRFPGEITPKQQDDQLAFYQSQLPALLDRPAAPDALASARMALLARHLFKDNAPGQWFDADQAIVINHRGTESGL